MILLETSTWNDKENATVISNFENIPDVSLNTKFNYWIQFKLYENWIYKQ